MGSGINGNFVVRAIAPPFMCEPLPLWEVELMETILRQKSDVLYFVETASLMGSGINGN